MMFRIVYTKLSYSLQSQCGINWMYCLYYADPFDCLPLAAPPVNCLAEFVSMPTGGSYTDRKL